MKPVAIEKVAMHVLGCGAVIKAWEVENLGGYLASTFDRELRRLRQMELVTYERTEWPGRYRVVMNEEQKRKLRKWLKERLKARAGPLESQTIERLRRWALGSQGILPI